MEPATNPRELNNMVVDRWIRDELLRAYPGLLRENVSINQGMVDIEFIPSPGMRTIGFGRIFQSPFTMTLVTMEDPDAN
jgi:hypothetical protein